MFDKGKFFYGKYRYISIVRIKDLFKYKKMRYLAIKSLSCKAIDYLNFHNIKARL